MKIKLLSVFIYVFFVSASNLFCATLFNDTDFNSTSDISYTPIYNGSTNQWLTDGGWHKSQTDPYDSTKYAESGDEMSVLYQVVNYQGGVGDMYIDYVFQYTPSGLHFSIYGSDQKPADGSSWDNTTWGSEGNPFGSIVYGKSVSGPYIGDWTETEQFPQADEPFNWYTIYIKGEYYGSEEHGDYAKIDNIVVNIPQAPASVPEPSVILLFVAGLGMIMRRKK